MKAKVDQDVCTGCGICAMLSPNVFEMNDEGVAEGSKCEIDDSDIKTAENALEQCPVAAITIV